MYIEYIHSQNKDVLKERIDKYVSKLHKLEFTGNFKIAELNRNWVDNEMHFSLTVKHGFLERRMKGHIKVKDEKILIEFELPEVVKNFVREEKLKFILNKHLDNVVDEVNIVH